jgi:hypothetical protein
MTAQNVIYTPAAPFSPLVTVIGEIIAPVVAAIAGGLISTFVFLAKISKRRERIPSTSPAPHVAMVMIPGNFMTGPFINH